MPFIGWQLNVQGFDVRKGSVLAKDLGYQGRGTVFQPEKYIRSSGSGVERGEHWAKNKSLGMLSQQMEEKTSWKETELE